MTSSCIVYFQVVESSSCPIDHLCVSERSYQHSLGARCKDFSWKIFGKEALKLMLTVSRLHVCMSYPDIMAYSNSPNMRIPRSACARPIPPPVPSSSAQGFGKRLRQAHHNGKVAGDESRSRATGKLKTGWHAVDRVVNANW